MYSITQCTHTETYTQWLGAIGQDEKTRFSRGYLIQHTQMEFLFWVNTSVGTWDRDEEDLP